MEHDSDPKFAFAANQAHRRSQQTFEFTADRLVIGGRIGTRSALTSVGLLSVQARANSRQRTMNIAGRPGVVGQTLHLADIQVVIDG